MNQRRKSVRAQRDGQCRDRAPARVSVLALLLIASAIVPAEAALVETFVLAAGGQSTPAFANPPAFACTTFRAPAAVRGFFGGAGVGTPQEGFGPCSIAGGFKHNTDPAGPLRDAISLDTTFNGGRNAFSGSASAVARFGEVEAQAHGTFVGGQNGGIVDGAEGYGLFRETGLAPEGTPGTPGTIRFEFTVDGGISVDASPFNSTADVELKYQLDDDPVLTLMRAQVNSSIAPFITATDRSGLSGFTVEATSISGRGVLHTLDLPFVFGTPFDFAFGLLAYAIPATGGEADASMTTRLTGIELFAGERPITDFAIPSDSGTVYGPNGAQLPVASVSEPATLLLLCAAVLAMRLPRRPWSASSSDGLHRESTAANC